LLGPLATAVVVIVLLAGVLPVYCWIAARSPHGQGTIVLVERLVGGWAGKTIVLVLLGFAATDFVMLKSISVADAAEHLIHNSLVMRHRPLERLAEGCSASASGSCCGAASIARCCSSPCRPLFSTCSSTASSSPRASST
jgi:hypothetical protein